MNLFKKLFICMIMFLPISCPSLLPNDFNEPDDSNNNTDSNTTSAPDSRFIGEWISSTYGEWMEYIDEFEWHRYESKEFFNSNKYEDYINYEKYGIQQHDYPMLFDFEWKIEKGKFVERLWENPYSDWEYYDFDFTDSIHLTFSYYIDNLLISEEFEKQ